MTSTKKTLISLAIAGAFAIAGVSVAQDAGSNAQAPQEASQPPAPQSEPAPGPQDQGPRGPGPGPGFHMPPYMGHGPCFCPPPPPPGGPQGGPGMGPGPQPFGLSWEDRITFLRGAIDLTDAQKPAWDAYVQSLDSIHHARPAGPPTPGPDFLNKVAEHLKAQLAAVESMIQARGELVKVLTPEQVKALEEAEQKFHNMPIPRPGMGPGPGPGPCPLLKPKARR